MQLYKNKEWLKKEIETKSVSDIVRIYHISEKTVYKYLKIHNIPLPKDKNKLYKNKEWLREQIKIKKVNEIALEQNVDIHTISRWLKKYNLSINKLYQDKEWLEEQFKKHNGSSVEVAKATGFKRDTLLEWCYKFNIANSSNELKRKYSINESYFNKIDTEKKSYFLGFLMADGAINKNCNKLQFNLQREDEYIIKEFCEEINYLGNIEHHEDNVRKISSVNICSKKIITDLIYHGIVPKKTGKEIMPDTIDKKLIKHFIRGFIDGDGHIGKTCKKISICSTSLNILYSIKYFLEEKLNIKEYEVEWKPLTSKNKKLFYYEIYSDSAIKVLNFLYNEATIFLKRKYNIYKEKYCPLK